MAYVPNDLAHAIAELRRGARRFQEELEAARRALTLPFADDVRRGARRFQEELEAARRALTLPFANLPFLIARSRELMQEIQGVETHLENLRADLRSVEATADAAGLGADFRAALAPPKEPEPIPLTRVKAVKAYRVIFACRHGPEEHSGAAGSINDIPSALVGKLKGRVEPVPPTTEIRGITLEPWMDTNS